MSFVYILAAILIFGVLIAVHELGHFLAAKLCGVQYKFALWVFFLKVKTS